MNSKFNILGILCLSLLAPITATSADSPDLSSLSFEELLGLEVTTAGKKTQKLSDVSAAVFVITQEDIRRSGATSIPEVLRMVPGLQVARIDANKWSISARGFQGRFANKLLVMIDGRSVYTPSFSGVYWEVQDTLLEDIERIEVIRGPGATLWGANAVNGVINIITQAAQNTRGGLASGIVGNEERAVAVRYGGDISETAAGRAYVKYFKRDEMVNSNGQDAGDDWDMARFGFHTDSEATNGDQWTFSGDYYQGDINQSINLPIASAPYLSRVDDRVDTEGYNLLTRWQRALSVASEISLQFYIDHTERHEAFVGEKRDTYDIEFQHRLAIGTRHDIIWGLGYRYTEDSFDNSFQATLMPNSMHLGLANAFIQDEISLIPEKLSLTLGSKFEYNDFTDYEVQPNARLLWTVDEQHSLWSAVSRAVRTPSRADAEGGSFVTNVIPPGTASNPGPLPLVVVIQGSADYRSEELFAYELGYRYIPSATLSFDSTLFYNKYDRLRSTHYGTPYLVGFSYAVQPLVFDNDLEGDTYGFELSTEWSPRDDWRLSLGYSYLKMDFNSISGGDDGREAEESSPKQQLSLRSLWNVSPDVDIDAWLRYVDDIPYSGFPNAELSSPVDSYTTLDLRLAWRPNKHSEYALVGQNLLESSHLESVQELFGQPPTEVERSVYVTGKWLF